MLMTLAAIVILAQATPEAAASAVTVKPPTRVTAAPMSDAPAPVADFTTSAEIRQKTVSPVTVTPEMQRKLKDEVAKRELVCTNEKVIGSLFPKQVCATKEELAERRAFDQAELRKAQSLRPYKVN